MPSHPIDYELNPGVFCTPELAKVFDERTRLQRWLNFEAALAKVQGELGVIPQEAAEEIERRAKLDGLDSEQIRITYENSRNSLMPLISCLRKACKGGHGEYIHYGTTTQDVLDTAQILELKEVTTIIYRDLRALEGVCLDLAKKHQKTPMVARTHGQQALPMTFGLKAVVWLSEIRRHIDRIKDMFQRISVGQLSGAVGTMAAFGPQAMEIAGRTLAILGLDHSKVPWHNSRDNIGEVSSTLSLMATSLEKMANEIFQLQKVEIGELSETLPDRTVTSTTMPHKTNPVISQRIVALCRHVRHLNGVVLESAAHEHERDARCLWAEWLAVPQLCMYAGTALQNMLSVMTGLEVRVDRMKENLRLQGARVTSEWLVFRLSPQLGKMKSLERIHELANKAAQSSRTLKEALVDDPEIGPLLTPEDLAFLDRPEKYIGHAVEIVEHAVEDIERRRKDDPDGL
jgi:adenylosuccinate lyase